MQNVKQASKFKLLSTSFLALFVMLLLSSCSKNIAEMPGRDNPEVSAINQSSAARVISNVESVPFERTLFVSCANDGAGEDVLLTGKIMIVDQIIFNDHRFTLTYHTNPQGVTGLGLSTGEKFIASGGSNGTITGAFENDQFAGGYIEQTRIIGQRSTFIVNYKFHVTITSDGKITSSISKEKVVCRM
jgi:hypothetical protein